MTKRMGLVVCIAVALALTCQPSFATLVSWSGSLMDLGTGLNLAARAEFNLSGNTLTVNLANTANAPAHDASWVLTALFFDIVDQNGGQLTTELTRGSASLGSGTQVIYQPEQTGWWTPPMTAYGNVGGEWAYAANATLDPDWPPPGMALTHHGISSSGFDIFSEKDRFAPAPTGSTPDPYNLDGPSEPDGIQYGILSKVDNSAVGNNQVTGNFSLIGSPSGTAPSVAFVLTGLPSTAYDIHNVWFQYGTGLDEPGYEPGTHIIEGSPTPVPEPASCALLALAVGGLGAALKRRRK